MAKKPNPKKKQLTILAIVLVVALLAVGIGIYFLVSYEYGNHAEDLSDETLLTYTATMTVKAHTSGWIGTSSVLTLHSIQKNLEEDDSLVFYVYQLPQGKHFTDYLGRLSSQMPQEEGFVHIGTLTCRLSTEDITSAYDINVSFTQ
jgi:hypothetical protein